MRRLGLVAGGFATLLVALMVLGCGSIETNSPGRQAKGVVRVEGPVAMDSLFDALRSAANPAMLARAIEQYRGRQYEFQARTRNAHGSLAFIVETDVGEKNLLGTYDAASCSTGSFVACVFSTWTGIDSLVLYQDVRVRGRFANYTSVVGSAWGVFPEALFADCSVVSRGAVHEQWCGD